MYTTCGLLSPETLVSLEEKGALPPELCAWWEEKHGEHPARAAQRLLRAKELRKQGREMGGIGARFALLAVVIAAAAGSVSPEQWVWWIGLGAVGISAGLLGLGLENRKYKEAELITTGAARTAYDFGERFMTFLNIVQRSPESIGHYKLAGLEQLAEQGLRRMALEVIAAEPSSETMVDSALPFAALATSESRHLASLLLANVRAMEGLGLSNGNVGHYYKLARRNLK